MADVTIAGSAISTPTSYQGVQTTGQKWLSYMADADFLNKNFMQRSFQKYGMVKGLFIRDLLRARGAERSLNGTGAMPAMGSNPGQDLRIVEELNWERPIILRDDVTSGIAGALHYFYLSSDCYQKDPAGTAVNPPCQKGDVINVPADFLQSGQNQSASYLIIAVADDVLTGDKLTVRPLAGTNSKIDSTIPAGTPMAVTYNAYAPGDGQPKGKTDYPLYYTYSHGIIKSTFSLEEEVLAQKLDVPDMDGNRWIINKGLARQERDHEIKEDWLLLTGQKNNDTTNLVSSDTFSGDSNVIKSCDGLYTILNDQGLCGYYDSSFATSHLDQMIDAFITQQLTPTSVAGYMGYTLYRDFCDIMNDHFREYSATDLYDKVRDILGVTPTVYNWKGVDFYVQPIASFNRPASMGLAQSGDYVYEYPSMGIFIPDNPITVSKFGLETDVSIPNVGIGYVDYNGENRGKVFGIYKGMTNMEGGVYVATDKGGVSYFFSSSPFLWGAANNQKMLWRKQKAA